MGLNVGVPADRLTSIVLREALLLMIRPRRVMVRRDLVENTLAVKTNALVVGVLALLLFGQSRRVSSAGDQTEVSMLKYGQHGCLYDGCCGPLDTQVS